MFPISKALEKRRTIASKRFLMKKQIVQVEIAPYQRIAKPIDENIRGMGTIEEDPDYIEFLKNLEAQKTKICRARRRDSYNKKVQSRINLLRTLQLNRTWYNTCLYGEKMKRGRYYNVRLKRKERRERKKARTRKNRKVITSCGATPSEARVTRRSGSGG